MRSSEKGFMVLAWVFLLFSGLCTTAAIISVHINGRTDVYDPTLLTVSVAIMFAAVIAFRVLPRWKAVPLAVSLAVSVFLVIAFIGLAEQFPKNADLYREVGLTPWEMVYRHYSMLAVPLCLIGSYCGYVSRRRAEKNVADSNYQSVYDLSGDALFSDSDEIAPQKKKRSVVERERKEQEKKGKS